MDAAQPTDQRQEDDLSAILETVFERAALGMAVVSLTGEWLRVNTALKDFLGYSAAEFERMSANDMTYNYAATESQEHAFWRAVIAGETRQSFEKPYVRKDGAVVWASVSGSPVTDAHGNIYLVAHVQDITERKLAEQALIEKEHRYRLLAENMSDMLTLHDAHGKMLYASPSFEGNLGYSPEAVLLHSLGELSHPEDRPKVDAALEQVGAQQEPVTLTYRVQPKDSDYVWLEMTITPSLGKGAAGSRQITGYQTLSRDVSERVLARQALERSEAKFRAIFDGQPNAVLYTDAQGRILDSNSAVDALFNYQPRELIDRNIWVLYGPDIKHSALMAQIDNSADNTLWELELNFQRRDGTLLPGELTAKALYALYPYGGDGVTEDSQVMGYIWLVRDVSERKRAERELAAANKRLVSSREEERLHMARELHDQSVQDLISVNFQVSNIQRSFDAIPKDELGEKLELLRSDVVEVIRQLRGLISDLRPAGLEEFGFEEAFSGFVAKLERSRAGDIPNVALDVYSGVDFLPAPLVICLFRAAQEALNNVVKHARAKNVKISLESTQESVYLRIEDDGRGFEMPEHISDFLQREHYGLAGVLERVQLMGGHMTLRSQLDIGTEVAVSIPVQVEAVQPKLSTSKHDSPTGENRG